MLLFKANRVLLRDTPPVCILMGGQSHSETRNFIFAARQICRLQMSHPRAVLPLLSLLSYIFFFFHLVDIYTQQRILKGYSFVPSDQLLELVLESLWALHSVKLTLDCIFEDLAVLQASPR